MRLYVIRHGQTDMGKNKIIANEQEPLNSNGIQQAIRIGKELNKLKIDLIYCSPVGRTIDTLELCNLDKNIPVIIDERIRERNMGIYEKVKFEDVDWEKFWNYHSDLNYSGLESMKSVYKRVSSLLEELKEKAVDKDILFVTHGGVSKAINWYFNGLDKTLLVENCKIYKYTI